MSVRDMSFLSSYLNQRVRFPVGDRSGFCEREKSSEFELFKAAEALVDAAICCHSERGDIEVSDKQRRALINAVLEDPLLTPHLFTKNGLSFQ